MPRLFGIAGLPESSLFRVVLQLLPRPANLLLRGAHEGGLSAIFSLPHSRIGQGTDYGMVSRDVQGLAVHVSPRAAGAAPRLTRRGFLIGALAAFAAGGLSVITARTAAACDCGVGYSVGWICAWSGWGYDWFSVTDYFDSSTYAYCGQLWIDTGVPC
jgi:hypothetical protein